MWFWSCVTLAKWLFYFVLQTIRVKLLKHSLNMYTRVRDEGTNKILNWGNFVIAKQRKKGWKEIFIPHKHNLGGGGAKRPYWLFQNFWTLWSIIQPKCGSLLCVFIQWCFGFLWQVNTVNRSSVVNTWLQISVYCLWFQCNAISHGCHRRSLVYV